MRVFVVGTTGYVGTGVSEALKAAGQVSSRRAAELPAWVPHRPGVLEEIEKGSYARP